jgi:hypothetical protein
LGASHLVAHPLVAVEPPPPRLRGSHAKPLGHRSTEAPPVHFPTKMGTSSIQLG